SRCCASFPERATSSISRRPAMQSSNSGVRRAAGGRQRGSAMIETSVCICVVLAVALGALWTGNIMLRYYQLEKAVQAAARYGARSETVPGGGAVRRRTSAEITSFLTKAAQNGKPAIDVTK